MEVAEFKERLSTSAFAFRGYNVTNLGRSHELLSHPAYGSIVRQCLKSGSTVCSDLLGKRVDLVARVRNRRETTLKTYAEAIGLIMAMERAQILLLQEFFDIDMKRALVAMGYSLGEITAVACSGVIAIEDAMQVPVTLAGDCAELAAGVTLGVFFSRGKTLPFDAAQLLCQEITQEGRGAIGISAFLSPNSMLLMGQAATLDCFKERMHEVIVDHPNLRKSSHRFPPMHTCIMWQRCIPNRAALLMQQMPGGFVTPSPSILSLVTGELSYTTTNAREILHRWVDHPQRLWESVYWTLTHGVETVVHVGPEPNIMPATYKRIRDNVESETRGRIQMRALKAVVAHPWVRGLLRNRTALLRAPSIRQIILEDWLLEQGPDSSSN